MKVLVTNIQRFCLNDGPGIRTVVFLKGCNLKCPWCCNPENISFKTQKYVLDGIEREYGKEYSMEELEEIVLKDLDYYDNTGGVTFSGGECLWQFEKIEELLKNLKEKKINICIETALCVPEKFVDIALKYVDEFLIDMKIVNKQDEQLIDENVDVYLHNLRKVLKNNRNVTIRIPVVPRYTYTSHNIEQILIILKELKIEHVELFKIHKLGEKKYNTLGKNMPAFDEVSDIDLSEIKRKIEECVSNVSIISM